MEVTTRPIVGILIMKDGISLMIVQLVMLEILISAAGMPTSFSIEDNE